MNKIREKIHNYVQHLEHKQSYNEYEQALVLLEEYDDYHNEALKLEKESGHMHFKKKEIEEKLLDLIDVDEKILLIQDSSGLNLGMKCAKRKLENVVIRALDNEQASLQQEYYSFKTMGMYAAQFGLLNATLKAMENKNAMELASSGEGFSFQSYNFENLLATSYMTNEQKNKYYNLIHKHGTTSIAGIALRNEELFEPVSARLLEMEEENIDNNSSKTNIENNSTKKDDEINLKNMSYQSIFESGFDCNFEPCDNIVELAN